MTFPAWQDEPGDTSRAMTGRLERDFDDNDDAETTRDK